MSNNVSAVLSIYEASISKELAGHIANVAMKLAQLGNIEAYEYGQDYPMEFNELGNNIVKDIEEIIRLAETQDSTLLDGHNEQQAITESTSISTGNEPEASDPIIDENRTIE